MSELNANDGEENSKENSGVLIFFALAFILTWTPQVVALLAGWGVLEGPRERFLPLAALGGFGPVAAALLVAGVGKKGGVRALLRPILKWRLSPLLLLGSLLLPGLLLSLPLGLLSAVGLYEGPLAFPPPNAQRVVVMLIIPFTEEIGWRGFALPRLLRRYGALRASLLIGVLWALWHLPMFELAEVPRSTWPAMLVFFLAGSLLFTWVTVRGGFSLLPALLMHAGAHLNNSHLALPADTTPAYAHTAGMVLAAALILLLDRRALTSSDPG